MTDSNAQSYWLELLADAMASEADEYIWGLLTPEEQEPFYRRARVALDALKLTEETREIPVANGRSCICNRPDGKHYGTGCDINRTDWLPHSRLVSPWVKAGGQ